MFGGMACGPSPRLDRAKLKVKLGEGVGEIEGLETGVAVELAPARAGMPPFDSQLTSIDAASAKTQKTARSVMQGEFVAAAWLYYASHKGPVKGSVKISLVARKLPNIDLRSLETAREDARCARFSSAIERLDAMSVDGFGLVGEAAVIRTRLALRTDVVAALEYVCGRIPFATAGAHRSALVMLEGVAHARLRDPQAATACFDAAAEAVESDHVLAAEIWYQRAASCWIERRLDAADDALDAGARAFEAARTTGDRSLPMLVPLLRGTIASSRGDFAAQGASLIGALDAVGERETTDVYFWATIVEQIASLARELPSPKLRSLALEELPRVPWTDDIGHLHFLAARSIGWCHALDGDSFNAFRMLREAANHAPSDASRVMARCDRSYLAQTLGESRWSLQELDEANELAGGVDWTTCRGDERAALVLLCELYASRDQALALSYLSRYRATRGSLDVTRASRDDDRVVAMEAYSFGVLQAARGNESDARRAFLESWTVYDTIGFDWRAGRVAKALAKLTGEREWSARAERKLEPYRDSWLGIRAESSSRKASANVETGQDSETTVSPAQRVVLALLLRGLTNAAIATELGRSEFTVRNHVKSIFTAFGVHSRSELLAKHFNATTSERLPLKD